MSTIEQFVAEKIRVGEEIDTIRKTLLAVGWKEDSIDAAIARALVEAGVPSPQGAIGVGGRKTTTVEIVVNVFSFILLGIVATALGTLYFGIIDKFFPDPLMYTYYPYQYGSGSVHYAIAALLVAFPLYVFAVRLWFRRFREDHEKEEAKLSKWLTYLVLLIAAITIVSDLIAVVFNFLQGETSARFFLKALTVLFIAGTVFGFYFLERRKIQYKKDIPRKTFFLFGYVVGAFVLIGIVLGFFAAGTPTMERTRQFDQQRANNLRTLASCVSQYATDRGALPGSLADLEVSSAYSWCATQRFDPVTREEYEYRVLAPLASVADQQGVREGVIELCAKFDLASEEREAMPAIYYGGTPDKWGVHSAGRTCRQETIISKDTLIVTPVKIR